VLKIKCESGVCRVRIFYLTPKGTGVLYFESILGQVRIFYLPQKGFGELHCKRTFVGFVFFI
jgi:hypothetical protein